MFIFGWLSGIFRKFKNVALWFHRIFKAWIICENLPVFEEFKWSSHFLWMLITAEKIRKFAYQFCVFLSSRLKESWVNTKDWDNFEQFVLIFQSENGLKLILIEFRFIFRFDKGFWLIPLNQNQFKCKEIWNYLSLKKDVWFYFMGER